LCSVSKNYSKHLKFQFISGIILKPEIQEKRRKKFVSWNYNGIEHLQGGLNITIISKSSHYQNNNYLNEVYNNLIEIEHTDWTSITWWGESTQGRYEDRQETQQEKKTKWNKNLDSIWCPQCRETNAETLKQQRPIGEGDQELEKRLDQKELT
jgi:hypothetical protein